MRSTAVSLGRHLARLVLDVLPTVLVGLLVFHLLRTHVAERYLVPSASMEPTLVGDPRRGDIVLVDKLAFGDRLPARYEMVVLRNRFDPARDHLVKRVFSTGDEWVWLHQGDVWVSPHRERIRMDGPLAKDPVFAQRLAVTHFLLSPGSASSVAEIGAYWHRDSVWRLLAEPNAIELRPIGSHVDQALAPLRTDASIPADPGGENAAVPTHPGGYLSSSAPVTATFVDRRGVRRGRDVLTRDNGLDLRFRADQATSAIHVVIEYRGHFYGFVYHRDGRIERTLDGRIVAAVPAPVWRDGGEAHLRCGYLDGRLFAIVDATLVDAVRTSLPDNLEPDGQSLDNALHIAAIGGPIRIERLEVFHDVYHAALDAPFRPAEPVWVEPGEIWVLGDNTFDSRDSRHGLRFSADEIVGQPWAVLAPASRRRWLR